MLAALNRAVSCIEANLTADLTPAQIAAAAGVSEHHLRTVFFHLTGYTLGEYLKLRRLAEASRELAQGALVTAVAFKYGYQSMDGFTRAFRRWCGRLPSEVKRSGLSQTFPKLTFIITVKGGVTMEYRLVSMPAFNLVGVSARVPMQFKGVNPAIVRLAESITPAQRAALHALQDIEPRAIISASWAADAGFEREEGELTHLIGVLTTASDPAHGLSCVPVPASDWAVFPCEGPFPATLQSTMAATYAEWLPSSGYEIVDTPSFSFTRMDPERTDYAYSETWLPVRKV